MTKLQPHPFCLIFPPAVEDDRIDLEDDIRKHGVRVPIVMFEDMILDGRSRYEACLKLKRKPYFKPFEGTKQEALEYAVSLNLCRRHLTPSQKAAVSVAIKRHLRECGIPAHTAASTAIEVSGASERYTRAFERIEQQSPKVAQKIALGLETIGGIERQWEAPNAIDEVLRAARDSRAAARRAVAFATDADLPSRVRKALVAQVRSAEALVEELEELTQEALS